MGFTDQLITGGCDLVVDGLLYREFYSLGDWGFFDASTGAVKEVLAWVEKSFEHYG